MIQRRDVQFIHDPLAVTMRTATTTSAIGVKTVTTTDNTTTLCSRRSAFNRTIHNNRISCRFNQRNQEMLKLSILMSLMQLLSFVDCSIAVVDNERGTIGIDLRGGGIGRSSFGLSATVDASPEIEHVSRRYLKRGGGGGGLGDVPIYVYVIIGVVVVGAVLYVVFFYNRDQCLAKQDANAKRAKSMDFDDMVYSVSKEVKDKSKKTTSIAASKESSKKSKKKKDKKKKKDGKESSSHPTPKSGSYTTKYREDRDREELDEILEFKFKKDSDRGENWNGYTLTVDRPRFKFKEGHLTTYDGTLWWREIHEEDTSVEVLTIAQYDFVNRCLTKAEWFSRSGLRGTLTSTIMPKRAESYVSIASTKNRK